MRPAFARMPIRWIVEDRRLARLRWSAVGGSGTAALTLYIALLIAHNRKRLDAPDDRTEQVRLTYDAIEARTRISRAKVASALRILESELEVVQIERSRAGNAFTIVGIDDRPFAQLPQEKLYSPKLQQLRGLSDFTLRSKFELGALKLYLTILALRNAKTGATSVGYDKLMGYTGVRRADIHRCISHLINLELVALGSAVDTSDSSSGHPHNVYIPHGLGRATAAPPATDGLAD